MSLHTEYRAKKLDQLIGNASTIESLRNVLDREKPPAAFLFTGEAGTGKTTLARIVGNELRCDRLDWKELNAAHDRGIDAVKELLEQMQFAPMGGPVRVIMLDEAHQITPQAQECLLKSLEEPPKFVHWIICTTNPEKLKGTLKRRCHTYTLAKLKEGEMKTLLKRVLKKERVNIAAEVTDRIVEIADGSAGQALKLLDMVIDIRNVRKAIAALQSASSSEDDVATLCRALLAENMNESAQWKRIAQIIKSLDADPESVRRAVLGYMQSVLLNSGNFRAYTVMESFSKNFYDTGKPGLSMACFYCIYGGE